MNPTTGNGPGPKGTGLPADEDPARSDGHPVRSHRWFGTDQALTGAARHGPRARSSAR